MSAQLPKLPWWVWLIGIFLLLRIGDNVLSSVFPILVMGMVLYLVFGKSALARRRKTQLGPGPWTSGPTDHSGGSLHTGATGATGAAGASSSTGTGDMPRIDVPRYPGDSLPPPPTGQPYAATLGSSGYDIPSATNRNPSTDPTPSTDPSASTDPAVSLARLQIAQAGRDLVEAQTAGNDQRVTQVLARLSLALDQAQQAMSVSSHGADRALRSAVDKLRNDVAKGSGQAQAGAFDAALARRIAAASQAIGQTGRHE